MTVSKKSTLPNILLLVFLLLVISTGKAHAYLDPGTGSYILQILAAGVLGGLFAVKTFWRQLTTFFSNLFSRKTKTDRKKKNDAK